MERSSSTKSSYPQRSLLALPIQQRYPQQVILNNTAECLFSHRVLLPSMVARVYFLPAESSIRQVYSPIELSSPTGILATIIPSGGKTYSSTSAQDMTSRHPSRIYFPKTKTYIPKHRIHHSMRIWIISYKSHLCWEHPCLIHIMHCIWLTFTFQERSS